MQQPAARTLDFPVTFRVRGTSSCVNATLLQLGLESCRIRTWRIMPQGETLTIELLANDGQMLTFEGRVQSSQSAGGASIEYKIDLNALTGTQADRLAREAAMLVRRRTTAA